MKRKWIVGLSIALLCAIAMPLGIAAYNNSEKSGITTDAVNAQKKEAQDIHAAEKNESAVVIKNNMDLKLEEHVNHLIDPQELVFERTADISLDVQPADYLPNAAPRAEKGRQNELDVFRGKQEETYYFKDKHDVSQIRGFAEKSYYSDNTPREKAVSEADAIEISNTNLKKWVPEIGEYALDGCEYRENDGVYVLEYGKSFQNIKTADTLVSYVTYDGNFGAFTAFQRGDFDSLLLENMDKYQAEKDAFIQKVIAEHEKDRGVKASYTVNKEILSYRDGQYYVDNYVAVDLPPIQMGLVIPVPVN